MRVEFLDKFYRDLEDINNTQVKRAIERLIRRVETARSLTEIPHVKKLTGYSSAYRIRVGDYRVGIFMEEDVVQFARLVHRKDIYRLFP